MRKTQQLQIRVTPEEKSALKASAAAAGVDVSSYVLSKALPPVRRELDRLLRLLEDERERRFALAEINGLLHRLTPTRLQEAVEGLTVSHLPTLVQNYLAAMVEQTAQMKAVRPPEWTRDVMPLEEPHFAGGLRNLRPHLLRASPVAFKRRNIFVDSSIGDRV